MISAFLEYFGVLDVSSVGESHGVNPFPHISALPSIRLSDLSSIGTSSLDDVKEMQNKLTS
mgnify:CR=1 FL=1